MTPSRKRLLRFLAGSAGVGALALGGLAWHYTRPEVQRGLALDALKDAGVSGDIAVVSAGLGGGFLAEGIDLTDAAGRRFKVDRIAGDFGVFAALTGEIHIGKLSVEGVVLDMRGAGSAGGGAPEAPAGKTGETSGKAPRIRVDAADVAGRILLSGGRAPEFSLRVRNADTRSGGTAVFTLAAPSGPVVTGEARLKLAGGIVPGGEPLAVWRGLEPTLFLEAEARPVPGSPVAATLALEADASAAKLTVKSGSGRLALHAAPGAAGKIGITAEAALDRTALAAWVKGALPEFSAKARFTCAADPVTGAWDATVVASGDASDPAAGSRVPGAFALAGEFSGSPGGALCIRNLHAEIGAAGEVVADVSTLTLYPGERRRPETSEGRAASVRLAGAKAAWLNPLLARTGWSFASGEASGALFLTRDATGRISLDSGAGLVVADLAVLRDGSPRLDKLALTLPVRAESAPDGGFAFMGTKVSVAREGVTALEADFAWKAGATGAGELKASAKISPGALPEDFLPGGSCSFCKDTGLSLIGTTRVSRTAAGATRVESANVEAVTREGVRALAVTLARPVDPENIPEDGAPVATLAFKGAPLSLFNPLLGGPLLGGVAETGELSVSKGGVGWKVARPAHGAPAFVRGLSWTDAGGAVRLAPTDLRGDVSWERTREGWRLALDKVDFTNAKGSALSGDLAFTMAGAGLATVDADLRGELPAFLASLPDMGRMRLTAGGFTLKAHHADGGESSLDLNLSNMRHSGSDAVLGAVVSARASEENGVMKWISPIVLSGPSCVTNVAIAGTLDERAGGKVWDITMTGGVLAADDWKPLFPGSAGVSARTAQPFAPDAAARVRPDTAAFWSGHSGKFSVAFEALKFSGETVVNPRLTVSAAPERLAAERASGEIRGIPVAGSGEIAFSPGAAKPYALTATGGAASLPLGKIVAAVAPGAAGWVEGDFDLRFAAEGGGSDLRTLFSDTTFSADTESRDGTLRFFKADNEAVRLSGEIAGMAGDLAGDLGKLLGRKNPVAGRILSGGSVIQKALDVMKYKKLTLSLKLLPDGSLRMPAAEVLGDTLRLRATGELGPALGTAFLDRNASVQARLDGRSLIAEALRGLGRASGPTDADGWLTGPELRYEGPLNNIRNNLLNNLFRAVSLPEPKASGSERAPVRDAMRALGDAVERLGR